MREQEEAKVTLLMLQRVTVSAKLNVYSERETYGDGVLHTRFCAYNSGAMSIERDIQLANT
jgi:hypothetical protein